MITRAEDLARHPLYAALRSEDDLRVFMRSHAFAVWDFQCLLKALQRELTCVEVVWRPTADPAARRLVNEIVLDEESDAAPDWLGGGHLSHFELYLAAMDRAGADAGPIRGFLASLGEGHQVDRLLATRELPPGAREFVSHTLAVARSGSAHRIAAAFARGREEIIPSMFAELVARLAHARPERWAGLLDYLERHVHTDGELHGPAARALVERLCGGDPRKLAEAEEAAEASLAARARLWDAVLEAVRPV